MQNGVADISCVITPALGSQTDLLQTKPDAVQSDDRLTPSVDRRARSCSPCPTRMMDSSLQDKVAKFNTVAAKHKQGQFLNPFSTQNGGAALLKPKFSSEEYGRPPPGSKTEARGVKAFSHVCKEMIELCDIIHEYGITVEEDIKAIAFGTLFEMYTKINNKLVGLLLRARKHEFITFEGEVLFQRRDDDVPIYLIRPIREIRNMCEEKAEAARRSVTPTPE